MTLYIIYVCDGKIENMLKPLNDFPGGFQNCMRKNYPFKVKTCLYKRKASYFQNIFTNQCYQIVFGNVWIYFTKIIVYFKIINHEMMN